MPSKELGDAPRALSDGVPNQNELRTNPGWLSASGFGGTMTRSVLPKNGSAITTDIFAYWERPHMILYCSRDQN